MAKANKTKSSKGDSKSRIIHSKQKNIFKYGERGAWILRKKFAGNARREHALGTTSASKAVENARYLTRQLTRRALAVKPSSRGASFARTFLDVVQVRLEQVKVSAVNTQNKVEHLHVKHLIPAFGRIQLTDINEVTIESYLVGKIQRGLKINPHVTELKTIFNMAWRMGAIERPIEIKRKDAPYEDRRIFTDKELARLLRAARSNAQTRKSRADTCLQMKMGYSMGMRSGEVLGFRLSFINLETGLIHLPAWFIKTKSTTDRIFPCNEVVLRHLRSRERKGIFTSFLFPSPTHPTQPIKSHKTALRNAFKKAGLVGRFHDFRRTFVTKAVEGGASLHVVTKLIGATPDVIDKHYLILNNSQAENIMNQRGKSEKS